jgi:hypothetical protein
LAGSARCADRATLSGAIEYFMVLDNPFRPLDAGGDIAARCPYHWGIVKMRPSLAQIIFGAWQHLKVW